MLLMRGISKMQNSDVHAGFCLGCLVNAKKLSNFIEELVCIIIKIYLFLRDKF
jgi:hypothetical protein